MDEDIVSILNVSSFWEIGWFDWTEGASNYSAWVCTHKNLALCNSHYEASSPSAHYSFVWTEGICYIFQISAYGYIHLSIVLYVHYFCTQQSQIIESWLYTCMSYNFPTYHYIQVTMTNLHIWTYHDSFLFTFCKFTCNVTMVTKMLYWVLSIFM
jgi:hypothetical protein